MSWFPCSWCGPCERLSPLLQAAVGEHQGRLCLATVDVDQLPELAMLHEVQAMCRAMQQPHHSCVYYMYYIGERSPHSAGSVWRGGAGAVRGTAGQRLHQGFCQQVDTT